MKAAIVVEAGKPPVYAAFETPVASAGKVLVRVAASALSPVAKSRASGSHYSAGDALPFVVGVDGVGIRVRDGRRVYFLMPDAPFGGMAEWTLVDEDRVIELPDALDTVAAAAMAIPGMSSWAALKERARLMAGETVLVHGATGASGRLAVRIARHLGAGKVIATGRSERTLGALGADVTIVLGQEPGALGEAFERVFHDRVDVVLDYLWGPSAEALLVAAATAAPDGIRIRYVQIGSAGGPTISLPSAVLRSSSLELFGSGINSVPLPRIRASIAELFEAAVPNGFTVVIRAVPLDQVSNAWAGDDGDRIVFTVG